MKTKGIKAFIMLVAVCLSTTLFAETKEKEMDPKMEAAMKLSTPGENHRVLDSLVGSWTHVAKWRMEPGGEPQKSEGTEEAKWILNGRFVQTKTKGEAHGQPFEGLGLIGYDNVAKEYSTVWMDNMGTGMMKGTGQYNASKKTITEKGKFTCPMSGKTMDYRAEWKLGQDKRTFEFFTDDENGKEFKSLEVVYKRVK